MNCKGINSNNARMNNMNNRMKTTEQNNSHKHQDKMMENNTLDNRSKLERTIKTNLGNNIDQIV